MTNTSSPNSDPKTYQVIEFIFILFSLLLAFNEVWRLPDEVVLKARRTKPFFCLILSLMFTGIGLWMMIEGQAFGVYGTVFFGLGDVVFFVMLLPNTAYLRLSREGFTECYFGRTAFYRWRDVDSIAAGRFGGIKNLWAMLLMFLVAAFVPGGIPKGLKSVVFNLSRTIEPHETARRFVRSVFGYDDGLRNTYGLKQTKLARLMNRFKDRSELDQQSIGPSPHLKRVTGSNRLVVVNVDLKESDLQRANLWFRLQARGTRALVFLWPLVGVLVLILAFLTTSENPANVTFVVIFIVFPVLIPAMTWFQTKRGFQRLPDFQKKMQFAFSADGYKVSDMRTSGDIAWGSVLRAVETKHSINLFFHPSLFYTIPKRCFYRPEDIDHLRTLLKQKLLTKASVR